MKNSRYISDALIIALMGCGAYMYQQFSIQQDELFQGLNAESALFQEINTRTKDIADIVKAYHPPLEDGTRKFYLEESLRAFNVEPLSEMQFDSEETKQHVESHDPRTDSYYTGWEDSTNTNSELYAGYYGAQSALDRITYVKWAGKEMGYGLFANIDLPKGAFLGEFTGILTAKPVPTDYMWSYAIDSDKVRKNGKKSRTYGIDSRYSGNYLRFANHVESQLNVRIMYFFRNNQWRMAYVTTKPVKKDEELYISYGSAYWSSRDYYDPKAGDYVEFGK